MISYEIQHSIDLVVLQKLMRLLGASAKVRTEERYEDFAVSIGKNVIEFNFPYELNYENEKRFLELIREMDR